MNRRSPRRLPLSTRYDRTGRRAVSYHASKLIDEVLLAHPDWTPPPFSPEMIASYLGIQVQYDRDLARGIDAMIIPAKDKQIAVVNPRILHAGRRNFSLAHEIAHTFFADIDDHQHFRRVGPARNNTAAEKELEMMCDYGAAQLLMPASFLLPQAKAAGFNATAVIALAARYEVSREAMARRLVQLHRSSPVAVAIYGYGKPRKAAHFTRTRGAEEPVAAYRVESAFTHRRFPYLPKGKSVAEGSVVHRASLSGRFESGREELDMGHFTIFVEATAMAFPRRDGVKGPVGVCATYRQLGKKRRS